MVVLRLARSVLGLQVYMENMMLPATALGGGIILWNSLPTWSISRWIQSMWNDTSYIDVSSHKGVYNIYRHTLYILCIYIYNVLYIVYLNQDILFPSHPTKNSPDLTSEFFQDRPGSLKKGGLTLRTLKSEEPWWLIVQGCLYCIPKRNARISEKRVERDGFPLWKIHHPCRPYERAWNYVPKFWWPNNQRMVSYQNNPCLTFLVGMALIFSQDISWCLAFGMVIWENNKCQVSHHTLPRGEQCHCTADVIGRQSGWRGTSCRWNVLGHPLNMNCHLFNELLSINYIPHFLIIYSNYPTCFKWNKHIQSLSPMHWYQINPNEFRSQVLASCFLNPSKNHWPQDLCRSRWSF